MSPKRSLMWPVRPGARCSAPNDESGLVTVVTQVRRLAPVLIVFEATGGLEVPLAGALAAASLPVVVVIRPQIRPPPRCPDAGPGGPLGPTAATHRDA